LYNEDSIIKNLQKKKKLKKKDGKDTGKSNLEARKVGEDVIMGESGNKVDIAATEENNNIKNTGNGIKKRTFNEVVSGTNLPSLTFEENVSSIKNDSQSFVNNLFGLFGDDETFETAIKEYLGIPAFPKDCKEKIVVIKKITQIYKKIREDKEKAKSFLMKIAEKIGESYEDVNNLVELEFLKSRREGLFSNLSKLLGKFTAALVDSNLREIANITLILSNNDVCDKLKTLQTKIIGYLAMSNEIK
jgi:hypothetical protein